MLWKALFEAGVYTNVALHPAVPPGGALLRTSLMATHERAHLDRALEIIAEVKEGFPDLPAAE
jgi:8-amino-7-oxononanoate synthase